MRLLMFAGVVGRINALPLAAGPVRVLYMYADLTLPFKTVSHAFFEGKVKHVPAKKVSYKL
jgi:hypothetical protein